MASNPTLAAAMIEARQAVQAVLAEEDLYPFTLLVDTNYGRQTRPSLSLAPGGTATSTGDSFSLSAGLSKAFSTGTKLSLDLSGTIDRQELSASSAGTTGGDLGPGYGIAGRLTISQPLLRGFGKRVGESSLRQARLSRSVAQLRSDRVASETLLAVLTAWWDLAYDTAAVAIQEEAVALARRQLDEVQARIDRGTLAPVEALTFLTALASREEERAQAIDARRRQALELMRLLGAPGGAEDVVAVAEAGEEGEAAALVADDVVGAALAASYEVRELAVQADLAREQARIAGEALRPRLDLQAWVQGEGLGNRAIGPAFEQFGRAEAGGAFVGLTFEMPLTSGRRQAQRAQAVLAVEASEALLLARAQQVQTEAESLVSRRRAADERVMLAARTVDLAQQQVAATRRRYEVGTAIALEVAQSEDTLRQARLRLERARIDRVQADLGIDHVTGRLLERQAVR
jgi:outer membrane protein TolC